MPHSGDSYSVVLKQTHLNWGTYRHTTTRTEIQGEAYVPIPKHCAFSFGIQLGDLYRAVFSDGFPSFIAKAAGNSRAGDTYAKQFQGNGDLKAFGRWYSAVGAEIDDEVLVRFIDSQTVEFTLIKSNG